MSKDKSKGKGKIKSIWADFKAFISRGSILDMAVGVIMGSAFSAIVTAATQILLSVCTWGVPGGINGLVTVLPAANAAQQGLDVTIGLGQSFAATDLQDLATSLAEQNYADEIAANADYLLNNPSLIEAAKTTILGKYTLHGSIYTYNLSAIIDWGTFINACISFLVIAITLFSILRFAQWSAKKRQELADKAKEEYYERHPEERPVPPEPGKPAPTEVELLVSIKEELHQLNAASHASSDAKEAAAE